MAAPSINRARLQASLACVGTAFFWWRIGGVVSLLATGFAGVLALFAWLSPSRYAPVQRALDRILHLVLTGLTWILLALLYWGLFTPMRLWRALTKQDPLHRRPDPAATSYLRPLPPAATRNFNRQF
jgi:hypothetical protein